MKAKLLLLTLQMMAMPILALQSCSSDEPAESPYTRIELNSQTRSALDANNDFAVRLLNEITSSTSENVVISPFSVFSTLAMMANGDDGEVRDETMSVLGFEGQDINALNNYSHILTTSLPNLDNRTKVSIANAICLMPGFSIKGEFSDKISEVFGAGILNLSDDEFQNKEIINKWVSQKTNNYIPSLLNTNLWTRFSVINATYFKGEWNKKFDIANTRPDLFTNCDKSEVSTLFMHRKDKINYNYTDEFEAVELKFGNNNFSMVFIRPLEDKLSYSITADEISNLIQSMSLYTVTLSLPKFEIDYNGSIMDILKRMGLNKALSVGYNGFFNDGNFKPNFMLHGVKIRVDEDGAEAVAVSQAGGVSSPGPGNTAVMNLNIPFIYLIRETSTGTILFAGKQNQFQDMK